MNLPGTGIHFDFFKDDGEHYFLSHFHTDHTKGLSRKWRKGRVYTSEITKELLKHKMKFDVRFVTVLEPFKKIEIINKGISFSITPLPANHCIGSLMFLVKYEGITVLFTGDFRYDKSFLELKDYFKDIDHAFIDTTYLEPKYKFPAQEESIEEIIKIINKFPDKIFIFGSYNIGKEKIFCEISKRFNVKIYTPPQKYHYYKVQGLEDYFTKNKSESNLYIKKSSLCFKFK